MKRWYAMKAMAKKNLVEEVRSLIARGASIQATSVYDSIVVFPDAPGTDVQRRPFLQWKEDVLAFLRSLPEESDYYFKRFEKECKQPSVGCRDAGMAILRTVTSEMQKEKVPVRPKRESKTKPITKKVFVVHGHDVGAREGVARYLEHLKLEPIILQEQASEGRTIIEKVEKYSDVSYAVVLLTPDDYLDVLDEKGKAVKRVRRARQNAVLELGYFLSRLGRRRVAALLKGDIELPSDYGGVVYIPLDEHEGWKARLEKELKAAGMLGRE